MERVECLQEEDKSGDQSNYGHCPYLRLKDCTCDNVEVNSGNSDAWCFCIHNPEECKEVDDA